jgi:pimeloyl-ACP methyl ester carboxylesterase
MAIYDTLVHRWLHVPYTLHVRKFRSPKKPQQTIVFLHGIGNSAESWHGVVRLLPDDVRAIGLDLLGFGDSPKPMWVKYNIAVQAKAVAHTLLKLGLTERPIIVGHSMGSLVAIELAKRFPLVLKQLVLCSPPLYKAETGRQPGYEKLLKDFYLAVVKHPERLENIAAIAKKLGIVSKVFDVTGERSETYVAALEYSIINQTSLEDVEKLKLPISILYGVFDPVVIGSNLKRIDAKKSNIVAKSFPVGHEIMGIYVRYIANELRRLIKDK